MVLRKFTGAKFWILVDFWILVHFLVAEAPILVEHWGGIICDSTPILPYFQHLGGKNLDHDFFHVSKLSADQKKVFTKISRGFFPEFKWFTCRPHQIIWVDADVDLSQIIGGDAVKLLGGIYPTIPPGFGTPAYLLYHFIQLLNWWWSWISKA